MEFCLLLLIIMTIKSEIEFIIDIILLLLQLFLATFELIIVVLIFLTFVIILTVIIAATFLSLRLQWLILRLSCGILMTIDTDGYVCRWVVRSRNRRLELTRLDCTHMLLLLERMVDTVLFIGGGATLVRSPFVITLVHSV